MSIIQQLEDLKEWSKDSTRYERRLAFRSSHFPADPVGTIPIDWDELSDREIEYYQTGPWSTREDYRKGQLVQPGPGRQGYAKKKPTTITNQFGVWESTDIGGPQVKPLTTATEKTHYKRLYGKEYKLDDWKSGNFTLKEEFSSSPGKKKVERYAGNLRADFRTSLSRHSGRQTLLNKLNKRGYISLGQLNKKLGRKDTPSAVDDLGRALGEGRPSSWLEEIPGVKKWKKSKIGMGSKLKRIEGGGGVFFKMPPKETLKGLKSYYKNQEYLSDFKYGKIKGNTIKNVQLLYDDEVLMKAIKKWSTKDEVPLKIIESVFGDGVTGPNSVMQLGKALKGDIKVPGVKKNVALGNKIIEAMVWQAGKKRGPWQNAMYDYAKGEMENLYKLHGEEWSFGKYYNETRHLLNKLGAKGVIDEVSALRSGLRNNNQIYSTFKQVIDRKINDSFKSGYDSRFGQSQAKVQKLLADKLPGWQDEVARLTGLQEGSYKRAKLKYPKIEFATFGEFDEATGKFAKPQEVFGKRFKELPSQIQKGIRKSFRDTGVSLNVGQTRTQEELFKNTLKQVKKELPDVYKAYRANGIGKNCPVAAAEGGRIGYFKGGTDQCMRNAIQQHNKKLADNDPTALKKQIDISKTKGIKNILGVGRRGAQSILGFVGGKWGVALEAVVEGAFYGYGRQQGESHEQARENLFFPKIAAKLAPKVWEGLGLKPFKTGIMEGPEGLIEEELLAGNESAQEYAQGIKALEDEYANASKIDFELGIMKNARRPAAPEDIEIKGQELRDSYDRIKELQINIKEGTPAHEAYVAAQEKQKALRDKRALDPTVIQPSYSGSKERQWRDEFLDYRGAERKYRKEQPFAFKGGIEANIGPTKEELAKGMNINWEEIFPRTIDTPRTTEQQKWDYIMNYGGFDLTDKISAAGGVANMAGGGIAGLSGGKRFGPPPLSGPMPQGGGLSSQFNRVKKLTG